MTPRRNLAGRSLAPPAARRRRRSRRRGRQRRPPATRRTASTSPPTTCPTFKVAEDGTVDWYTFSGYRRYHADCHVCHGPDGQGSSYAPAHRQVGGQALDYYDFLDVVANGRQNGNQRDAELRHQPQRDVLPRRHLHLSEGGRRRAIPRGRPAEARRQAARPTPRPKMPAWAEPARRLRRSRPLALALAAPARGAARPISCRAPPSASAPIPANLPFSNEAGEGFENKIAELFADELGRELQYTWYPDGAGLRAPHAGRATAAT